MTGLDITLVAVFIAAFAILISPPLRRLRPWSATITPLASIIGSGFLVSVPLLASAIGLWSIPAVAALTGLAWLIGGALRYNIRHGEPLLQRTAPGHIIRSIETASHLVLICAYFISVAYYLVLLAAFVLKLAGIEAPMAGQIAASAIILAICAIGALRGLEGIQRAETFTVAANLAAIAALLVTLALFGLNLPQGVSWSAAAGQPHALDGQTIRFLMGLLIIVQGFETTRFMGQVYDAETRIRAMRRAQLLSSAIYLVFFVLMIPLYPFFTSATDVAGFIGQIGRVTPWLPYVVTAGAVASQFSAAVADSIGAGGLISETTHRHVDARHAYVLIGAVALLVVWDTDLVSVVALASRAFALFYALQGVVAMLIARERKDTRRAALYGTLAAAAFAVALFGIPAGA